MTKFQFVEGGGRQFADNAEVLAYWEANARKLSRNTIALYRPYLVHYLDVLDAYQPKPIMCWDMNLESLHSYIETRRFICRNYRPIFKPAIKQAGCAAGVKFEDMPGNGCRLPNACTSPKKKEATYKAIESNVKAISSLYRVLVGAGTIKANWVEAYWDRIANNEGEIHPPARAVTLSELHKLITGVQNETRRAVYIMAAKTGMRAHELGSLRLDDEHWNPTAGWGKIPLDLRGKRAKSGKKMLDLLHHFPVDKDLVTLLRPYLDWRERHKKPDVDAFFVNQYGDPFRLRTESGQANDVTIHKDQYRLGLTKEGADRWKRLTLHSFRRFYSDWLKREMGCPELWYKVFRGDALSKLDMAYIRPTVDGMVKEYAKYGPLLDARFYPTGKREG